jgi:hypothetical protein
VQVAALKRNHPTMKHQMAFKRAGIMWSEMSDELQRQWQDKADVRPKSPMISPKEKTREYRERKKRQKLEEEEKAKAEKEAQEKGE